MKNAKILVYSCTSDTWRRLSGAIVAFVCVAPQHEGLLNLYCGVVMSGEDAPRPSLENLIVPEIKTNKQFHPLRLVRYTFTSVRSIKESGTLTYDVCQ